MGWDVKATADRVLAAVDGMPSAAQLSDAAQSAAVSAEAAAKQVGSAIAASPMSFVSTMLGIIALMSVAGVAWRIRGRVFAALEETMFSNWRLALLGATGVVLSLASGYTTWDGMRNFTGEALLSLMVTFGIQGVMLIVAWLIGESFAVGMNQQSVRTQARAYGLDPLAANIIGAVVGMALFVAAGLLILQTTGGGDPRSAANAAVTWAKFSDKLLVIATALLGVAFVTLYAASDLVRPYLQSARVIIKNSVLWVMFLSCMATSVFFSFDSLFTAIFPQSERVRAAELRAQNQVAGILADIETKIVDGRLQEAQSLFHAPGFETWDGQMAKLAELSRESAPTIEAYFNSQIEDRNRAIKQQQERMTTAQGGQAGLAGRKAAMGEELSRLRGERPALAADFAQKKTDLETKNKDVDAKRVEAMAEAGGVEGSGKEGRGPIYRQRMEELGKLQAAVKIAEERLADAKKRLTAVEARITQIEREQATIDGDLAKLKGEAETAEQRIKLAQEQLPSDANSRIDPSRITPAFEAAKADFRQDPTVERLAKVQQMCTQIYTAMVATPQTKKAVAGIDCDPKQAAEAASVVFALNAGSESFAKSCKGGDKLNQHTSADALFGFARKCLADSGLPSKDTDELRTKINAIELGRDDKAHRFVVTWNAFQDGNKLAYLALAIAIAIDSLVFMSGLFGANAVRSPLSDVPSRKARSAQQLEATINAALGKLPYDTAFLVLSVMRPITNTDGFSAIIDLGTPERPTLDRPTAERVRQVLTAGADIHAVEAVPGGERYRVRSELREYLSRVCDKHFRSDKSIAEQARLEQVAAVALKPFIHEHADLVINHLHPIKPTDGFTSEISLASLQSRLEQYDKRIIRRVINAGATSGAIAPDKGDPARFYFRPDFVQALQALLAHSDPNPHGFEASRQRFLEEFDKRMGQQALEGGRLRADVAEIDGPSPRQRGIGHQHPAEAQRAMSAMLNPPQQVAADDGQRFREFVSSLVAALGVDPNMFLALSGPAVAAAAATSEAFARARRANQALDTALTQRDEEARMAVDQAFYGLESTLAPGDGLNRQRLKDAFEDIDQNWAIVMLMPGGPYERLLAEIIEALEPSDGEGALGPRESGLLSAARHLRRAIGHNPRNSEMAWNQLGYAFAAAPGPQPMQQSGNGKPMLQ